MFYGAVVWDPWMIVAQIVCLQCLYYLTLGVFLSVLVGTRVSRMSLVYFFDFAALTASTVTGWCVIISFVLSAIAEAGYMLYLIERAKKCLDFSATLFIIHLFICITYGGWPASINWWVVNGIGLAVMALLGEHYASDANSRRSLLPGTDQAHFFLTFLVESTPHYRTLACEESALANSIPFLETHSLYFCTLGSTMFDREVDIVMKPKSSVEDIVMIPS